MGSYESETVVEILEQLLKQAPGAEPHDIRVTEWIDDEQRHTAETEELWADFIRQYQEVVQEIAKVWGTLQFEGTGNDAEFPSWHHWVARLAYWRRENAIAYVECDQQDSETPMILVVGAKAAEELDEDYT